MLIPQEFIEFSYHIGSCSEMHSIIASGLIAGRRIHRRDRQTVFFTAVDPMDVNCVDQVEELDMSQPRYTRYKHVWKSHKMQCSENGRKFYQTRSIAMFLYDTLPPVCIERVVSRRNYEILFTRNI